ncbi:hypothetical protein HF313_16480 [Massilia atriviolacea]|uniref:DUF4124 domain-containing protein n=1 Tax=Massilia atriviolacea TaxID=2495579 RepID=A0A430HUP9_9BURK|nr:hypothetical protein [Massilia atriviolacea]RSZ61094.1 hypothetical protein EJB06_02915 [Massilia atriviolacea]
MALRPAARLCCLLLVSGMPAAQAALFKYVDPVTRMASYTNYRPSQAGARELALRLDGAPRRVAARVRSLATAAVAASGPMLGPANFPRIDAARQRELDTGRRHIIGTELQSAEAELARLLAGGAAPDQIGRRRGDVAALRRELERLP